MPNLAWIGLRVWVQEPQEFSTSFILRGYVWLYIVVYAHHDEIWQRRVCYVPALTCQIWPRSGIGVGTVSLQRWKCGKMTVFGGFPELHTYSPLLLLSFPSPLPFPSFPFLSPTLPFPIFLSPLPLPLPSLPPFPFSLRPSFLHFSPISLIFPSLSFPNLPIPFPSFSSPFLTELWEGGKGVLQVLRRLQLLLRFSSSVFWCIS